jgi:putative transcriptional regulator
MTTAGDSLIAGLNDAIACARGDRARGRMHRVRVPDTIDVKAIRKRLQLTQREFAQCYGFGLSSIRHWEQRRRKPEGAARMLLAIIDKEPKVVQRVLGSPRRQRPVQGTVLRETAKARSKTLGSRRVATRGGRTQTRRSGSQKS